MKLGSFYTLLTTMVQSAANCDQIFRCLWACCTEYFLVGGFGLSKLSWVSDRKTRPHGLHATFAPMPWQHKPQELHPVSMLALQVPLHIQLCILFTALCFHLHTQMSWGWARALHWAVQCLWVCSTRAEWPWGRFRGKCKEFSIFLKELFKYFPSFFFFFFCVKEMNTKFSPSTLINLESSCQPPRLWLTEVCCC